MKDKIKYWAIRIFKGKDQAFDFATDMQMKNMNKKRKTELSIYHKILLVIYVIAIPIPFGITFILLIYSVLYYVFKMPLRREKYLLMYIARKIKNPCSKD